MYIICEVYIYEHYLWHHFFHESFSLSPSFSFFLSLSLCYSIDNFINSNLSELEIKLVLVRTNKKIMFERFINSSERIFYLLKPYTNLVVRTNCLFFSNHLFIRPKESFISHSSEQRNIFFNLASTPPWTRAMLKTLIIIHFHRKVDTPWQLNEIFIIYYHV